MAQCLTCGANWSSGRFSRDCSECDGGALERDCMYCGGRCGARLERAVSDSNDSRLGHWLGCCKLPGTKRGG